MAIVAEYDRKTVRGNGCGGVQMGDHMYINSGGSPVNVSSADPHHEALYGFDVYRFPATGYSGTAPANSPAPEVLFSKDGAADSAPPLKTARASYCGAGEFLAAAGWRSNGPSLST